MPRLRPWSGSRAGPPATSGRAIAVSGLTVMISLAGLFLTGIDVFSGLAIGTIVTETPNACLILVLLSA
jgi:uncharacterized membrane protein YdfJ with MMPL/SSD domain